MTASSPSFKVLLVDDDAIVRTTLALFLEREGYEVLEVGDGDAALALIAREAVDLIVLDVQMPGRSGLDVLRAVRAMPGGRVVPVIMATARDDSEDIVQAFALGADDYVTKPFELPVVGVRIQARLRARASGVEGTSSTPSDEVEIAAGAVLDGKYRLESTIGRGRFGVVYRATHLRLERYVAVKLLHLDVEPTVATRFRQEGISACRVQHPHAVSVLDFSVTAGGEPYLVMELLEGRALDAELAAEGRLDPRRCGEILDAVCSVLTVAHGAGVLHRDIKPQNVFLHRKGEREVVKVVDFGIAKLIDTTAIQRSLTIEGGIVGTPAFIAPERITGDEVGGPADIYSLGVTLYQLLTGRLPFQLAGRSPIRVLQDHLQRPPDAPRYHRPELPDSIDRLVLDMLDKDMSARPTAAEVARRYAEALEDWTPPVRRPVPRLAGEAVEEPPVELETLAHATIEAPRRPL